jgi:hypothetical protein
LDAAKQRDVQMLGITIEVSARSGAVEAVVIKAKPIEDARTNTEPDDV